MSVSLPDDLLADMDGAIESSGYRGRSEFVRASLRTQLAARPPSGDHMHGSITIVYAEGNEPRVSQIRHAYHDVVLSLMHTHCEVDTCMDVLIVGGKPTRIQALQDDLLRMREVKRSTLVAAT